MICHKCGSENKDGAKFCSECGTAFLSSDPEVTTSDAEDARSLDPDATINFARLEVKLPSPDDIPIKEPEFLDNLTVSMPPVGTADTLDTGEKSPSAINGSLEENQQIGELPAIDEEYDFSPIDDETTFETLADEPLGDMGEDEPLYDTSGIDQTVIDTGYTRPAQQWKAGDTMEMPVIKGDDLRPVKKEFRAPDPHRKKKEKRRIGLAIAFTILLIAGALAAVAVTYQMEIWGGKTLPDVVGKQLEQASSELEELGFSVRSVQEKSDEEENKVLSMEPDPGSRIDEGSEITLRVAVTPTIPEVVSLSQDEAEELLRAEGYTNVTVTSQKSDQVEGTVLSVSPEAGEKALSTTEIALVVSQAYVVPDVVGLSADEASEKLRSEGYEPLVSYVYSEQEEGTVISTEPEAKTKLASGSTIEVKVAKSRANELVSATWGYLEGTDTIKVDGITYNIVEKTAVTYVGDEQTQFLCQVRAITILDGEEVSGSVKEKTITFTWNSDNEIESIS